MNFNKLNVEQDIQTLSGETNFNEESLTEWRQSLDECYERAKEEFANCIGKLSDDWEKKKEIRELSKNGSSEQVTYLFRNTNSTFYKWLGYSEFEYQGGSISNLFSFITKENDMTQRRLWDPDLNELKTIALLNDKNWRVCLQVYNTNTRFVSNREFVIQYDIYEECENIVWLVCRSIPNFPNFEDAQAPYRKGNVRGIVHSVAWRVEKVQPHSFKMSFCIHSDPGGMISSTIYNLVSEKQALNTCRIIKALDM